MYFYRNVLVILIMFNFCNGQQPADKGANAKTKEILDYIAGLPKQGICLFNIEYLVFFYFSNK